MPARALLPCLLLMTACSSTADVSSYFSPYRIDVRQCNFVTQDMVAKLKPGMTREQVRFMLGTPLLASEFHKNRVDYVYYLNPRRGQVQNRRLTLFFKESRLDRFENDPMPGEDDVDALILGPNIKRVARVNRQPEIPMPDVSTPAPGSSSN